MEMRFLAIPLLLLFSTAFLAAKDPVPVIFDTDITGDVDDVLALAMLHTLADRGQCELLGVTISKSNPLAPRFVDAVNTFYGRPDLPVGDVVNGYPRESKYLSVVDEKDGEVYRYPHDVTPVPAVDLLRELLEDADDESVALISVGIATNLAQLLDSPGGSDLIRRKVRELSIMAGAFQTVFDGNRYLEANVVNDIPSMQKVAREWPGPIVWSGFEVGIAVRYPRESIANDFNYTPHHIVKESYLLHSGPNHDRPSWDLTSVLYSVFPEKREYFDLSTVGRVSVDDDGATAFVPAWGGRPSQERIAAKPESEKRDRFLKISDTQTATVTKALVDLVSTKPRPLQP